MGIAHAARRDVGAQIVGPQIGQHRELGVEQGHVDHLTLAGGIAVAQRGQDSHGGIEAGEQVGHRNADLLRPTAG